jgi:hypothetical protein
MIKQVFNNFIKSGWQDQAIELSQLFRKKQGIERELVQYICHPFRKEGVQQRIYPASSDEKNQLIIEIDALPKKSLKESHGLSPQQIQLQNELIKFCYNADLEKVKSLIEQKGADPAIPDDKGQYPLAAAIQGMAIEVFDYLEQLVTLSPDDYAKLSQQLMSTSGYVIPDIPSIRTHKDWLKHFTSKKDRWMYNENQLNRRGYGFKAQYIRFDPIVGSNEIKFLYINQEKSGKRKFTGVFIERSFKRRLKGQMPFLMELYKAMSERLERYNMSLSDMNDSKKEELDSITRTF